MYKVKAIGKEHWGEKRVVIEIAFNDKPLITMYVPKSMDAYEVMLDLWKRGVDFPDCFLHKALEYSK
jgi:hypothetical protein